MTISSKPLKHMLFDVLYYSGTLRALQPRRSGIGIIFLLHRIVPAGAPILAADLVVQTDFLDELLGYVKRLGWEIVSVPEVHRRLVEGNEGPNFACFTFDDGYLDNLTEALPVFRRHKAPMCVYVTTGLVERTHFMWWPVLEWMLLNRNQIKVSVDGQEEVLPNETFEQKEKAYWRFVPLLTCHEDFEAQVMDLFRRNEVDPKAVLDPLLMHWKDVRELAADPLVEIGCHAVSHRALANIGRDELVWELKSSRELIEKELSRPVPHLSYPYGTKMECSTREFQLARELGFETAVTTRPGNIFPAHRDHLTALPRLNLKGGESASLRIIREGLFGASARLSYAQVPVTD
jgi:peptidoglycan/xylan/chitin deacetylase (PgdA/CDA1 family)